MPRLSVIVPAHNVAPYVGRCIESVLAQTFDSYDFVIVDDCSDDSTGHIIDEYAAVDDRVVVAHLERNVGPGPARNIGIRQSTGEYLIFLDGDDALPPGALTKIARRLEESHDPDVLIYNIGRLHPCLINRRSELSLAGYEQIKSFDLRLHPELFELGWTAANKAFRRSFTEDHGFSFPAGHYEDIGWTCPVLATASNVAVLDEVCVLYRRCRRGSRLHAEGRQHFDLFEQYARIFEYFETKSRLGIWKVPTMRVAVEYLNWMAGFRRIPLSAKAEFARRCYEFFERYVPVGYDGRRIEEPVS